MRMYMPTCRTFVCRRQVLGGLILLTLMSAMTVRFRPLLTCSRPSTYLIQSDSPQRGALNTTRRDVMLLSYGRSGTSFTSAVISHHPEVFLFFEPLHGLEFHGQRDKYFVNAQEVLSRKVLESLFACDLFMDLDAIFLFGSDMFKLSNSTHDFYQCFRELKPGVDHMSCFYEMVRSCRRHNTVLVKTIRYRVKWTESLLQTRPDFKLLLLYRDPRATLHSQSTAIKNFNWTTELVNVSKIHCRRLEEDMREAVRLRKLYPDRVKCIRYEDGATDPQGYARDIYQFLGLELDRRILRYVTYLTNAKGRITRHRFGIEKNAKQVMSLWRNRTDFGSIRVIDRTCGHLYDEFGYSLVSSEADLRSTRSLVGVPPSGKLF